MTTDNTIWHWIATIILIANAFFDLPAGAQERIVPSTLNPGVQAFDDPSLVYAGPPTSAQAPLVVYLAGTGGRSETAPTLLLKTVQQLGYRVIFLTYDDVPAGNALCLGRPPACLGRFRQSRVFGGDGPPVATPRPEAIVQRLRDLLRHLHRQHPQDGWNDYLDTAGEPVWSRIVLAGLSQGAGMAAYMAQRFPVHRVVLFSSPWDVTGPGNRPAPWLYGDSATPPDRWWAERHVREKTTQWLAHAYDALRIPHNHILLFDGDLHPGVAPDKGNPYHGSTVSNAQYVPQWRVMFGQPGASQAIVPSTS